MELHYTNCTSLHAKHFLVRCKCCLSRCYNCASCESSACGAPLFFWQACQRVLGWATHLCETAVLTCRHKLALERNRFMALSVIRKQNLKQYNYSVGQSELLTGFRTDFSSWIWNFSPCRRSSWRNDSLAASREERRPFSQAKIP